MEGLKPCLQLQGEPSSYWMNSLFLKFRATISLTTTTTSIRSSSFRYRCFCAANGRGGVVSKEAAAQLKESWLGSLSCPFPNITIPPAPDGVDNLDSLWVIGVDPDVSGAIAVLRPTENDDNDSQSSALVFDSPHVKVLIGKRTRRRLDAKSIVHLLKSFNAPIGTTAYLEQSIPFPQDGKQKDFLEKTIFVVSHGLITAQHKVLPHWGWWSGGFGYGLWIGVLVASGFTVVPVPSAVWKNEFRLCGSRTSKDDSRQLASTLYPSMSPLLKRKKDHGRAEALLIAAYGKGLKLNTNLSGISEEAINRMD